MDFGPATQRRLGDLLGLDPSDMVRLMDELIELRMADRDRDPADRRRYRVTLTPGGWSAWRKGAAGSSSVSAIVRWRPSFPSPC